MAFLLQSITSFWVKTVDFDFWAKENEGDVNSLCISYYVSTDTLVFEIIQERLCNKEPFTLAFGINKKVAYRPKIYLILEYAGEYIISYFEVEFFTKKPVKTSIYIDTVIYV